MLALMEFVVQQVVVKVSKVKANNQGYLNLKLQIQGYLSSQHYLYQILLKDVNGQDNTQLVSKVLLLLWVKMAWTNHTWYENGKIY